MLTSQLWHADGLSPEVLDVNGGRSLARTRSGQFFGVNRLEPGQVYVQVHSVNVQEAFDLNHLFAGLLRTPLTYHSDLTKYTVELGLAHSGDMCDVEVARNDLTRSAGLVPSKRLHERHGIVPLGCIVREHCLVAPVRQQRTHAGTDPRCKQLSKVGFI